jgi:uncharacterized protein YbjT (DUF2867 family)
MRIVLAGASGLVGGHLAQMLPGGELTLVGRRLVEGLDPEIEQCVLPSEEWPDLIRDRKPEAVLSTLGTTIAQAGSKAAFRSVDHDLVVGLAQAAAEANTRQFMMVSSVGASEASRNFYLKTKGEAERGVLLCGLHRTDIFQPGLLRGERAGPSRGGEAIAQSLAPFTDFLTPFMFDHYRSVAAADVARAMVMCLGPSPRGAHIHRNREIVMLAKQLSRS